VLQWTHERFPDQLSAAVQRILSHKPESGPTGGKLAHDLSSDASRAELVTMVNRALKGTRHSATANGGTLQLSLQDESVAVRLVCFFSLPWSFEEYSFVFAFLLLLFFSWRWKNWHPP
jgi:hypothetical protein